MKRTWFFWVLPLTAAAGLLIIFGLNIWSPFSKEDSVWPALQENHKALAPELATASNTQLTEYFRDKLNGLVQVPVLQPLDGHQTDLIGGRLARINGIPAAHLMYRCCGENVSV